MRYTLGSLPVSPRRRTSPHLLPCPRRAGLGVGVALDIVERRALEKVLTALKKWI
jgi:hypothetical protein